MNRENLLRAADLIERVPQERFDMCDYRKGDKSTHECGSIGCGIGHATILDTEENLERHRRGKPSIDFDFDSWHNEFFGFDQWYSPQSIWCFCSSWSEVDNTPTGCAKRIRYLVSNGLPENYTKQMYGKAELCY